jgi:predicted nucleotidyltransferase
MRLECYSSEKLGKEILDIIGKYLDLDTYKVFFFGSRISGTGDERSDIDIGIDGPGPVPPVLLSDIRDEIDDLPTLYKIEIVDFKMVSQEFREVALQHMEGLN